MPTKRSEIRRIAFIVLMTAAVMWVLLYAPTPYVVYEPGIAVSVKPMITAEQGDAPGKGDFLLTAVKLTEPNFLQTFEAMWNSDKDVYLKRDVLRGYSRQQYVERSSVIMKGSQNNAVEAAYGDADIDYASVTEAIIVSDVQHQKLNTAAAFHAGDRLVGLKGGEHFESMADILEALKRIDGGKDTTVEIERGGRRLLVPIFAGAFHSSLTAEQMLEALGVIGLTELRSVEPADSRYKLDIAAGEIGGPSAGLVFALQAIDLLTEGDMSGGHRIAATGTITADGEVGPIGGIRQKIVVTSRAGAELFLAPADNYEEASAKARELGTAMKVVSVATLQEAKEQIEVFIRDNRA
ncbi:hypothetical protein KP806_02975 [Paenibacillus sp. N4]|uniref:S16 family serine protease n=1 Tax=Paenibacillus vietnamensis TaxID=2590547 RepID=UPI001CD0519C|nr:S16 family serine protease [Paenibacillus vietnamensis]MCA0753992.1 hypothetical protein [Paenibacillus vietnamensis]